ncbi:MAG: sulfotransferase [Steroidobacteraceae bacterium]|jgi:hypothetical protein|nr:sulfotransferase [Steroidobacteraceae bacterium]
MFSDATGAGGALWRPAARPRWVQEINDLGADLLACGERLLALDARSLLSQARTRTGLTDFGSEDFLAGLDVLTRALEEEAELTLMGRIMARDEILNALECRLRIEAAFREHPQIAEEVIEAPILIGGSGRSGTTILHELLAQDPACRAPLGWEVRDPYPPAQEDDPRIEAADRAVRIWRRVAPETEAIHPLGARLPQECSFFLNHSFRFGYYAAAYRIPSYVQWLSSQDLAPTFAYHRRFLQVLQWRSPRKRWVLKMPGYIDHAESVLRIYPDAKFLHTHRDPLKVIPSMTSFIGTIMWMRSDRVMDVPAFARMMSQEFCTRFERVKDRFARGVFHRGNYCDVLYHRLVDEPLECMADIYHQLGMEFTGEARRRMRDWLDTRSRAKRNLAGHRYGFEQTGLDQEAERERRRAYQSYFDIPPEA